MLKRRLVTKLICIALCLTFITGQAFAGIISSDPSNNNLALSSVMDGKINPARSDGFTEEVRPGQIGNGRPMARITRGEEMPARLALNDDEIAKLQEAAKLAVTLSVGYSNPEHAKIVSSTIRNLINFRNMLRDRTYLYNMVVEGPEDYSAGFSFVKGFTGLTKELVDTLPLELLAQYVFHENVPESQILLKEIKDERSAHRAAYTEIQTEIFGDAAVLALKRQIRGAINEKLLTLAEAAKRTPVIGGNWKMAVNRESEARALLVTIADRRSYVHSGIAAEVIVAPSFAHLSALNNWQGRSANIYLAAQDVSVNESGAFTGQTSVKQLKDLGVSYIILGHSERRRGDAPESSALINKKAKTALANGFKVIVCVGEDLKEFEAGKTKKIVESQIRESLAGLTAEQMKNVVIAYEPVWAIGTGKVATPEQANDIQRYIRALLLDMFGFETAAATRIQYGGSVKADNIGSLIAKPNIDGALVGGASLKAGEFVNIVTGAEGATKNKEPPAATQPSLAEVFRPKASGQPVSAPQQIRTELKEPEGQPKGYFTNDYNGYRIAELFAQPIAKIPDAVVNAVRRKLDQDVAKGRLLSAVVMDFGGTDIDIHVTHRYGEKNAAVERLMLEAIREGCLKAQKLGLLKADISKLSLTELAEAMRVKAKDHSIVERGSEPVVVAKIIGGGIGAANIPLYHEFFMPGSTPLVKLGFVPVKGKDDKAIVRGFRAVVRKTVDVMNGKMDGDVSEFEFSSAAKIQNKNGEWVEYKSVNEAQELLAFASQPNDYVITEIYAVEGSAISTTEPMVSVVCQSVYGEKGDARTLNPAFIFRSQSGADAVGGVASMFYGANFVPGGPNGERYVAMKPVTLEEARKAPEEGIANVVVYGWESEKNGVIARVVDHVGINPPALSYIRKLARWLAGIMKTHKDDQPYLAPFAAEARVEGIRKEQAALFTHAPKEAEIDMVMNEVEAQVASGKLLSVTDDKADMGGDFGHNYVPDYMSAVYRATLMQAARQGKFVDANIIGFAEKGKLKVGKTPQIGDDGHQLMIGDRSRNSAEGHHLSFLAFTRAYLIAFASGKKPYGLAQDYQGKEAKAAKANPYAHSYLDQEFFDILGKVMPNEYMYMVDNMYAGWQRWEATKEALTLPEPFSGNVSQQGIGSARFLMDFANGNGERTFGVLAGDKMGPAGINRPIREGVYAALAAGEFANGLVFEIWDAKAFDENGNIALDKIPAHYADIADAINELKDEGEKAFVKSCYVEESNLKLGLSNEQKEKLAGLIKKSGFVPTERIFLDAEEERDAIYRYLADSDRFNIKQVWSKKKKGWDINNFQAYLLKPILGSSVTKLGILAGGEYIGKDDPVMVGSLKLMEHIWEYVKRNPILLQGDMNGSHWLGAIPTKFKYAVANVDSHPILVGLRYKLNDKGTIEKIDDVFSERRFDHIRNKMFQFNFLFKWVASLGGQFAPYGTDVRTVEAAYPLAKFLRQLQNPASPFMVKNKPAETRKTRPIDTFDQRRQLFEAASAKSIETAVMPEKILQARAQDFRVALEAKLKQSPDQCVFVGIENKLGEAQKSQIMPLYKAVEIIAGLKDEQGRPLYPNLVTRKGSAESLIREIQNLVKDGKLKADNLGNVFIGATEASVDAANSAFNPIKGKAWISAFNDSNAGDYLPVFEAITLNMMASIGADLEAIKGLYDAVADKSIDPAALQDMLTKRIVHILPKATRFDTKELRKLYELAAQIYVAA